MSPSIFFVNGSRIEPQSKMYVVKTGSDADKNATKVDVQLVGGLLAGTKSNTQQKKKGAVRLSG